MGLSSHQLSPSGLPERDRRGTTGINRCCRKYVHRFVLVKKATWLPGTLLLVWAYCSTSHSTSIFRRNVIRQCIPFGFACRNDVGRLRELGVGVQEAGRTIPERYGITGNQRPGKYRRAQAGTVAAQAPCSIRYRSRIKGRSLRNINRVKNTKPSPAPVHRNLC